MRRLRDRRDRCRGFSPEAVDQEIGQIPRCCAPQLSDRIRKDELYAFVEIPANALEPATDGTRCMYYSNHPSLPPAPRLDFDAPSIEEIVNQRFRSAAIDRATSTRSDTPDAPRATRPGLARCARRSPAGGSRRRGPTLLLPSSMMTLMFLAVMSTSPQLLNRCSRRR